MKRRDRLHLRATEKETAMLRELASDLDTTITGAVFDAVRFAYLHLDLIVAWNRTYKHEESDMSRLSDDEKVTTLSEIKEAWVFTPNIGATSYWFEQTDDGTGETIGPEEVLEIGCQLESQIDAMRDFMALLYLGIREGREETFEALDDKTKHLINEVWFERLEEDGD